MNTNNRFDFLRLVFAVAVFIFHAVVMSSMADAGSEALLGRLAELSIQGFFIISGMLVYGSLERSKGIADYAAKRIRRLYPAYIVVILIPAMVSLALGGAIEQVGKYIAANLVFLNFLQPTLPGLFEGHRFPAVNGALWTLKIEVMYYMILPILAWALNKAGQAKWGLLILIYVAAELWRGIVPHTEILYATELARQLPGQMSFFVVGMMLWMLRDKFLAHIGLVGLAGLVCLALSFVPQLELLRALGLGGAVFTLAYSSGPKLSVARLGDLSYGVYITHFPIVNALVAVGLFADALWQGLVLATVLVFASSLAMWHLVEKRFLRKSSHYRKAAR